MTTKDQEQLIEHAEALYAELENLLDKVYDLPEDFDRSFGSSVSSAKRALEAYKTWGLK